MTRPSDAGDFDQVGPDGDADPSPLRRLILAQEEAPGGAAVALWTDDSLPGAEGDPFTLDGYVVQSALGERLLGGDVPPFGPPAALAAAPLVAVNYHEVEDWRAVEERLRRLADLGSPYDPDASGPQVLVGLYDAYREPALRGAALCERLGLRAWLFPVFAAPDDEPGAAELRDDELADLARRHELGFHTHGHVRSADIGEAELGREVLDVLDRLTAIAGRPPRLGAWRGGTRFDAGQPGDRALRGRGVTHLVSNWSVETVPIG